MNKPASPGPFGKFFGRISSQERINFARHLSVAVKSGIPIVESLRLIRRQASSRRLTAIIDQIIRDVNNGQFLAQSLERFTHVFGDFFINMVRVGESSGNLSQSLLYLSVELKKQRDISHKVRSALIYPIVILVVTLGVTSFLTFFIFPKILPIFTSLRVELPLTTKIVIWSLTFFQNYGFAFIGAVIALLIGLRSLLLLRVFHYMFDRFLLSLPFLSGVIVNLTMANFTRTLSVLLKSGMTVIDSLLIVKDIMHNLYYKDLIEQVIEGVRRGESMTNYLESKPKFFPPMFAGMIQVGESTGNLQENLSYLSEYYENEVDETVRNLTTIIEPALLVVMGLLVGFVALSIITPIYKITQGLQVR